MTRRTGRSSPFSNKRLTTVTRHVRMRTEAGSRHSMGSGSGIGAVLGHAEGWRSNLLWLAGFWVSPLWWILLAVFPSSFPTLLMVSSISFALAPLPAMLIARQREGALLAEAGKAREQVEQLRLELDTVSYRTARLREELSAADQQARLSHKLAILGQFTAGFLHEFNNPLAIVTNRIEVLLEERKDDAGLCTDLGQMLKETQYMGNVGRTLLQALRRESNPEVFEASLPEEAARDAVAALAPLAERQSVRIDLDASQVPRVNLPAHVVSEVVRGLVANALQALNGRADGVIWLHLEPYRTVGSKVVLSVEDNGPGVPKDIQDHLFEPFVSHSPGRERLGLGLFLAASLLDVYDGSLRHEPREGGGARFIVEMPPARFTRGQPYHWFVKGDSK